MADDQPLVLGVRDHLGAVGLATAAYQELDGAPPSLQLRGCGHRHQPALVRVKPADLEPEVVGGRRRSKVLHRSGIGVEDRLAWNAIGVASRDCCKSEA